MNPENSQYTDSLVKYVVKNGGTLKPLILPSQFTNGTNTFNPSIFVDDGEIYVNIRQGSYMVYRSELKKFPHHEGPLKYIYPSSYNFFKTENFILQLDKNLDTITTYKVDMALDVEPKWHFAGLEDCRLVKWENKLYLCGVRRDTTPNGQGRMELSEVKYMGDSFVEINRYRMPAPVNDGSYCEKNWMPILDKPYHFVKWTNPTEVVKFNIKDNTTDQVFLSNDIIAMSDLRGGSQLIPYKNYYLAITHESHLKNDSKGRIDNGYKHKFVVWDKNYKLCYTSEPFTIMDGSIEFAAGMCFYNDNLIISFGFADNCGFLLDIPKDLLNAIIKFDFVDEFFCYNNDDIKKLLYIIKSTETKKIKIRHNYNTVVKILPELAKLLSQDNQWKIVEHTVNLNGLTILERI